MADNRVATPSVRSLKKSGKNGSPDGYLLEESTSKYCIPVMSNTILIKNCQAKVFGGSSLAWSEITNEFFSDNMVYHEDSENKQLRQSTATSDDIGNWSENGILDVDSYFETISSSDGGDSVGTEGSEDIPNLPATLRLLEEVNFRILGDRSVSIPKIEKVFTHSVNESESDGEIEETAEESPRERGEGEEESTEEIEEYLDTVKYSEQFVDNVLQSAKQMCKYKHKQNVALVAFAADHKFQNIDWPTIEQFTVEMGIDSIDKYIHHAFILEEDWKYKITFLIGQSDKASDFYFYEAKFCIPTSSYPIAQATVSVFFTLEVSRVIPKNLSVRATFTIESLRTVMVPGEVEVNDQMLLRVLYAKLAVFKQLNF